MDAQKTICSAIKLKGMKDFITGILKSGNMFSKKHLCNIKRDILKRYIHEKGQQHFVEMGNIVRNQMFVNKGTYQPVCSAHLLFPLWKIQQL